MVLLGVKVERSSSIVKAGQGVRSEEAVVFCPRCKALQTVWVSGDTLMPIRKFKQVGGHIYHDCGSSQPCRLFYSW